MRPKTKWEKFKARFIWGQWGWNTLMLRKDRIIVGKLKVMTKSESYRRHASRRRR